MQKIMHNLGHEFLSTDLYADDIRWQSQSQLKNVGQVFWHEIHTF